MRIPLDSPHMPGMGDEITWPGYHGGNDPRVPDCDEDCDLEDNVRQEEDDDC